MFLKELQLEIVLCCGIDKVRRKHITNENRLGNTHGGESFLTKKSMYKKKAEM